MYEAVLIASMLVFFFSSLAVASYLMDNPLHGKKNPEKPLSQKHLTVDEIRRLNQQYAAQRARAIDIERGKVLTFSRKSWYKSTRPDNK